MKKFLALVLSLIMVLSMVSLASAEDVELQFVLWDAGQKAGTAVFIALPFCTKRHAYLFYILFRV